MRMHNCCKVTCTIFTTSKTEVQTRYTGLSNIRQGERQTAAAYVQYFRQQRTTLLECEVVIEDQVFKNMLEVALTPQYPNGVCSDRGRSAGQGRSEGRFEQGRFKREGDGRERWRPERGSGRERRERRRDGRDWRRSQQEMLNRSARDQSNSKCYRCDGRGHIAESAAHWDSS